MIRILQSRKGVVFISVLMISMLMIFIAVSASNMLLQDAHMVRHLKETMQAQYLAEAGLADALATLDSLGFSAKDTAGNFPETVLGSGKYDVTIVEDGAGRVLLSSVGTAGGTTRTASAEVEDAKPTSINYIMSAGNNLKIRAGISLVDLTGQIHANNSVSLLSAIWAGIKITDEDAATSPDAAASDDTVHIDVWNISGNYIQIGSTTWGPGTSTTFDGGEGYVSFPSLDYSYYIDLALGVDGVDDGADDYYDGDQLFGSHGSTTNLNPSSGVIYVNGNVELQGTVHLYGGIVANSITIKSKLWPFWSMSIGELRQHVTGGVDLRRNVIISYNDITIGGRLYVDKAFVYADRDIIGIQGFRRIEVDGLVMAARDINLWDVASQIDYDHVEVIPDRSADDVWVGVVSWNR